LDCLSGQALTDCVTIQPMSQEEILYRGYRLLVRSNGASWKVIIYAPGAILAETFIPNVRDPFGREAVLAEAKAYVDRALDDMDSAKP
jgi:hypothetical protein